MNRLTRIMLAAGVLAGSFVPAALAQDSNAPQSKLSKQLERVDFSLSGMALFNSKVSGTVPDNGSYGATGADRNLTESAGNTAGLLAAFRWTAKPYFGLEYNATYGRYTETFTYTATGAAINANNQIQTGVTEQSFGYVITPRQQPFGLQPVISVGAGSTRFKPTKGGGESSPTQWRATYYYNIGVQKEFGDSHFGARLSMREAFFKAPDFLLNYLTLNKMTTSFEPNFGVYVRF